MANMNFKASLLPSTDNTYSLGSSTKRWKELFLGTLNASGVVALQGETTADSLTAGNLLVTGGATFDTLQANKLTIMRNINGLITGSGITAQDKGSGVSPRYFPAKWTFDTGANASNGDIFTIKIPCAGHSYGVFMSVNNGINYYPVVVSGTSRVTTHYGNGIYISVIFDSNGSAADMFALNGADSRAAVSGGVFRVINFYDSGNTNTLLRTYSSATNIDVPLVGSSAANSTTAAWSTYSNTYKDLYGVIPNDDAKRAKINLSTGVMTVPGGITANLTGNATSADKVNKTLTINLNEESGGTTFDGSDNASVKFYAPTAGGTANIQALVGNGATAAPKWVNINPSIDITAGTSSAAPKINVTVLGRSGTARSITTASTSVYGVTKLNSATNSTSTTTAATPSAVKSAYDLAKNHKYWANVEATSAAAYNKAPEMATIKLNGNTSASAASTKNVQLVYDSTLEVLNFVFS